MQAHGRARVQTRRNVQGLALLVLGMLSSQSARSADAAGRLVIANGKVSIVGTAPHAERAAHANDAVFRGDTVMTGAASGAKLLFTDQTIMDLGPESSLKVDEYALRNIEDRVGLFSLLYGKLRTLVTKSVSGDGNYSIKTQDSIMGVRGTEFMVEKPRDGATAVVCVSGMVAVAPATGGAPLMVGAGQKLVPAGKSADGRAPGSASPTVAKASAAELKTTARGAKTADTTFASSVTVTSGGGGSRALASVSAAAESGTAESSESAAPASSMGETGAPMLLPPVVLQPGGGTVHLRLGVQ